MSGISKGKSIFIMCPIVADQIVPRSGVTEEQIEKGYTDPLHVGAARSLGVEDANGETLFVQTRLGKPMVFTEVKEGKV